MLTPFVHNHIITIQTGAPGKASRAFCAPALSLASLAVLFSLVTVLVQAQEKDKPSGTARLSKSSALDLNYGNITVAQIGTWHRADGLSNHTPSGQDGGTYPTGTLNVIYQDGIIWGGKLFTDPGLSQRPPTQGIRVGGTGTYSISTRAGAVTGSGATAERLPEGNFRVWRIRRDYLRLTSDMLRNDAALANGTYPSSTTELQMTEVLDRYKTDWAEWPVQYGAPFIDRNRNGVFDPVNGWETMDGFDLEELESDEPGIAGANNNSPADQVLWMVFNDLDPDQAGVNFLSLPLGFEVQKTVWAYANGSSYFARYRIINKGGVIVDSTGTKGAFWIDSMYVAQWSDPDIGDHLNDVGGCDTSKNLGFVYNGSDVDSRAVQFGLPVAAVGYDLLQGPSVPGLPADSVLWDFRYLRGKKAMPMTSCIVFSPSSEPSPGYPGYGVATGRGWQMLRGYAPTAFYVGDEDKPYPTPPGFNPIFNFPSDPDSELTTGWLDGGAGAYTGPDSNGQSLSPPPGDRRIMLSSGPFYLAPGDTQEIIIATTAAFGFNRFNAVTELKRTSLLAQQDYDNGFQRPVPPAQPNVRYSELNGAVILEWGSDQKRVRKTEEGVVPVGGYHFEGYNIYQFPSAFAQPSEARRIATFDVKNGVRTVFERRYIYEYGTETDVPVQFGNDTGIRRYFLFDRDYLFGREKLSNGAPYYLGISAYAAGPYTPGVASSLESLPIRMTVKPQRPFGTTLKAAFGDTLQQVTRTGGTSPASLIPIVIDPTAIIPATYDVTVDTTTMSYQSSQIADTLIIARQDTLVRVAVGSDESAPIFEGVQWRVSGTLGGADAFVVGTSVESKVQDAAAVDRSIERVNVFPNPYFGMNPQETSAYRRFVTFNNLPQKARLRIFNLAGHLVRILDKDDPSQFLQWDLTNADNYLVASGLYIVHLEFPDLGRSKILKLGIIQEHQVPGKH